jgi:HlyD family secretion protein
MKRLWQNLPLILAVLTAAGIAAYALWPRPIPVDLATVTEGPLEVTVNEDGKTRVRDRYLVSAPLQGRMARIELEPGDRVEAGKTLLATIQPVDPELLDERTLLEAEARVRAATAAGEQAKSRIVEARESHESARHEYERVSALRQSQAVSAAEFDLVEHEERRTAQVVRSAEFALQVAQFELELARATLLRTRTAGSANGESRSAEVLEIRAPVSGRVLRRLEESARVVEPGLPLLEVGDPEEMEVEIDVLSSDAAMIRPGAKVWLEQWGGPQPLEARVRLVEPAGFTKISALGVEEQRVNVIADFVEPAAARETLGDAYRVEARIVVWESPRVLKLPAGSLFRHAGRWAVYRIAGSTARLHTLEIGHNNGVEAEVVGGLLAGDRIVVHPSDKLADGARIAPRPAE